MTLEALAQQGRRYVPATLAASVQAGSRIRKELVKESFSCRGRGPPAGEVANIHGIEFINDSRACSVNSTWFALESMRKPVIWIAGGLDRVLDYSQLLSLVGLKSKGSFSSGRKPEAAEGIRRNGDPVVPAADINEAVDLATTWAKRATWSCSLRMPECRPVREFRGAGNRFRMAVKNL